MIEATDVTVLLGEPALPTLLRAPAMPTLLQAPALPSLLGDVRMICPQDGGPCVIERTPSERSKGTMIAMTIGAIVVGVAISAVHGAWAYGDWTCAFKSCVAVAPVRRRRRKGS